MDDRYELEHDFRKTIREAADIDTDEQAVKRAQKLDSEAAYETLAVNASMGAFGMEDEVSELMQLELAQELMYKARQNDGVPEQPDSDPLR